MAPLIIRLREYGLYLVRGVCVVLLVSGCYTPPPIPAIRTPIPVPLHELLLTAEDLPTFAPDTEWGYTEPFDVLEQWDWSNAIAAIEVWFDYGVRLTLSYTVVQYRDSAGVAGVWQELRDAGIVPEVRGEVVDVLSLAQAPPLHAERVWLHCEHYGRPADVPLYADCIARLQYDVLYVQFHTRISETAFSPDQFYDLLRVVDERMRPVWEAALTSTLTAPGLDSSVEITPTVALSETRDSTGARCKWTVQKCAMPLR